MIRLEQAVIVEGKYDKITLENIIDAVIITTGGFSIFKDTKKCAMIRLLAKEKGIIVITDSDSAGLQIRSYLKKICPENSITNVYIPQLLGKEKRKEHPSKSGYLGVEGMSEQIILDALKKSGIEGNSIAFNTRNVTKQDFYKYGLSGNENSKSLREQFALFLGLPSGMSSSAFLDAVNAVLGYEKFIKAVEKWQQEEDKR